ncbi:MAG: DnaJ subfamily A member 3, mitochondrial, partial [Paramarteilia canceri]
IPEKTSSADILKITGKGVKSLRKYSPSGDHIVHFRITVPNAMNEKQKALIIALAEEEQNISSSHSNTKSTSSINGLVKTAIGNLKKSLKRIFF